MNKKIIMAILIILGALSNVVPAEEQIYSRELNELNWIEIQKWVPSKIDTVLLPVGTIEPHGVINNGADNTMPEILAKRLSVPVNALIAPLIPYGLTESLAPYPGAFGITENTFKAYVEEVLIGLYHCKFKNIIILNGHGPNYKILKELAVKVSHNYPVRILAINWWAFTDDITREVYKQEGGHAGINENAAIMAVNPSLVRKEYYSPELALPLNDSWFASPYPASILLYKEGEGYPDFDAKKAEIYLNKVVNKLEKLIKDVISKWNKFGL